MFTDRFKTAIEVQKQAGLYRNPPLIDRRDGRFIVIGRKKLLNFSSNDYLGLSGSRQFSKILAGNFRKFGTSSASSRLVSGNCRAIRDAEQAYAQAFGYEHALFFPSGFQANIGVISTLFEPGDHLFFDKHIHASSVTGIQLSGADFKGYNHSSLPHLEKRLKAGKESQKAVITESLFSMDGDLLDVAGLKKLKEQYPFFCIVDEAHAFGVVGEQGRGIAGSVADVAIGTFGKAFGFFGAFVLLSAACKEFLFNFAAPLIYSTCLPEAHAASAVDLLEMVMNSHDKRERLSELSMLMKESLRKIGFRVTGDAQILAIEIGDENRATALSRKLFDRNIYVFPARYPTVPMGKAILRISMTARHTQKDIQYFVDTLKEETGE
ncbi:MAG: pyridoxal phosphate-dependent aminotransferase family protein [Pseudomonadota bacterium]